jgi:5-methyltetrahydrofolate--homocysteine methyltransferase
LKKDLISQLNKQTLILDGAMGTMLQNVGLPAGSLPELLSLTNPDIVYNIHKAYIDAGSDIIYSNTFGANPYKLSGSGHTTKEIVSRSIEIAKSAASDKYVALDIGPIGQLLEPNGLLTFEDAIDIFKEIMAAGENADLIAIETMADLYEVKAAIIASKEVFMGTQKPVFVTMTIEENKRTFLGCSLDEIACYLNAAGVDAIGLNCSLGPVELKPIIEGLCKKTSLPVILKPNAGLPDPITGQYNIGAEMFSSLLNEIYFKGVSIFGGCCGTTPDYIKAIAHNLKGRAIVPRGVYEKPAVCSSTKTVYLDSVKLIGERINPTGKKLLKEAIKTKNMGYIIKQGLAQVDSGADILDVNIGLPEIDEAGLIPIVIKSLQKTIDSPLQIDSSDVGALEAGLRVYNGKPIVNSVNGDSENLDKILPLVKKYGSAVIGLTLDKNGIPESAEGRYKIAEKILNAALSHAIKKEDVYIDCLTLTASAQQKEVMETIKAVRLIKEGLGLKTVLGVSNVSFGLPNRELINSAFLTMALANGLDLPIINPNNKTIMDYVHAYKVLSNSDVSAEAYIKKFSVNALSDGAPVDPGQTKGIMSLNSAIISGIPMEAEIATKELLKTESELNIVDSYLIKALDIVGKKFEAGELFLPQLLLSAEAAQSAFETLKNNMALNGTTAAPKGKIILATVKGDIHDIGKNIVKALLQNYGYEIFDLGKDVPPEEITKCAISNNIKLIGLSALMTTTIKNMQETIYALRKSGHDCKIVVGGAVLTEEYAKMIGADYYAKDAMATVDIARATL